MLSFKASAQNECCSGNCNNSLETYFECGPYDDFPGPFHVRIYLHFVVPDDPNAFDEPLKDRADNIWKYLREEYNQYNIFFVPGFGNCTDVAGTFQEIESNATIAAIPGLLESYGHTDGVDMFVFTDNAGEAVASADCVPSHYCYFQGTREETINNITTTYVLSKTRAVVVHEVAHCLGLAHTFEESCEDTNGSEPECWESGDFVCDTPPDDGNSYNQDGDCTPSSTPSVDFDNFMSGFKPGTCLDHFTEGQVKRMRHYLGHELSYVAQIKAKTNITTTTTWNTPKYPTGNITVETGAALIIDAPVYMPENAWIYVERGGTLTVRNTITGACGKMWQGIVVDGNELLLQTPTNQGTVYVTATGVIEHARCGVRLHGWDSPGVYADEGAGGMLKASLYATFRNNTVGVQFDKYVKEINKSYLQGCTFTVTDDYRGDPGDQILHLKMHGVYGVRIGGQFLDERTGEFEDPGTRARGIDADNATFSIAPNFSACHFEGLLSGIRIYHINQKAGSCAINGASFEKCFTGIYSNDHNTFFFGGNSFDLVRPDNYVGDAGETLIGILLDGPAEGFMLTENTFGNSLESENTDLIVGCDAVAIGTSNNRIFKNVYEYQHHGNRASSINAAEMVDEQTQQVLTYSGLWYECNVNAECLTTEDFFVPEFGKIRYVQGKTILSANIATGNTFSGIPGNFINLGSPVRYYYDDSDPDQEPFDPVGLFLEAADPNGECEEEECPPPCDTEIALAARKTQFFQLRQAWNDKREELPAITNPAKRQLTADTVNFLRARLDREGGLILMHYALDTLARKVDSMLTWLEHLQTYETDFRLVRHHLFSGDIEASEELVDQIPSRYELDEATEASFLEVQALMETVNDYIEEGKPIAILPGEILDTLELNWGAACSQAGALARNLLYRNGRDLLPDCSGASRPVLNSPRPQLNDQRSIHIYPNPAKDEVFVDPGAWPQDASVIVTDLGEGRLVWEQTMTYERPIRLSVGQWPEGIYLVTLVSPNSTVVREKLLILR